MAQQLKRLKCSGVSKKVKITPFPASQSPPEKTGNNLEKAK